MVAPIFFILAFSTAKASGRYSMFSSVYFVSLRIQKGPGCLLGCTQKLLLALMPF